jgi:hypothetical protein
MRAAANQKELGGVLCTVVAWQRCCLLPILTAQPERGSSAGVPGARK